MAKMDGEIKVKVELDSELQAAREALKKWKAKREKPRVCRGCNWLTDEEMCQRIYAHGGYDGYAELYVDDSPNSTATLQINDPDDFGCNKWEAKP